MGVRGVRNLLMRKRQKRKLAKDYEEEKKKSEDIRQ